MTAHNYTTAFKVDQPPEQAFAAINNVGAWWPDIEGSTNKRGSVFTHRHGDMHRCTIEVVELVPDRKVVWLVLDNFFDFTQDKTEWKDTRIVFDIVEKGAKTEVRLTHEGLVPDYECFNLCSNAWGSTMNGSLRSLIAKGEGSANQKEDRKVPWRRMWMQRSSNHLLSDRSGGRGTP